jgi:hypothetical protein
MAHYLTWPAVAGLAIVGAVGGITLGRSAVAEINPAYFSSPDSDFHADLVPNRAPANGADWGQVQQADYASAATAQGLGSGCVGCREYPVEYVPVPDPALAWMNDGWQAGLSAEDQAEPEETAAYAQAAPDPRMAQIERYSRYRVRADEPEYAPEPQQQAEVQVAEASADAPGEPSGM